MTFLASLQQLTSQIDQNSVMQKRQVNRKHVPETSARLPKICIKTRVATSFSVPNGSPVEIVIIPNVLG